MIPRLIRMDTVVGYLLVAAPVYLFAGVFARLVAESLPPNLGSEPISAMAGPLVFLFISLWFIVHFAMVPSPCEPVGVSFTSSSAVAAAATVDPSDIALMSHAQVPCAAAAASDEGVYT